MMLKIKTFLYNFLLTYRYASGHVKVYHAGSEKSFLVKLWDLLRWIAREKEFNRMYYAFGLNLTSRNLNDYVGRQEFLSLKNRGEKRLKEKAGCKAFDYDVVTKDKFIANSVFAASNIPCLENKALYHHGKLIFNDGNETGIEGFWSFTGTFIVKNTVLEAGDGVLVCSHVADTMIVNGESLSKPAFQKKLANYIWVVQLKYHSCEAIRQVNDSALNTTRVVTIFNGKEPEYLGGFQAFATGGATTDSWSKGSIYVGINLEKDCLKADGYCSLDVKDQSIVHKHPDSGVVFQDYPIPGLKAAVELCLKAHKLLYFNHIVGWDVAITDNGPVIVEANEKPGMNVVQCIDGGMRKRLLMSNV